ncbi:zinc finger protein 26-like [Phlebotomus argentipes]|uniref:zinc finger protein 26-like n=1 Tax=Phlebotomus argentipes TaxID=94469 RepID=UPI002893324C|nr:zinc finger protein 26-like [Phlebotomus argentipes]
MEKNPLDINEDDDIVFVHTSVPTKKFQNTLNLSMVSSDSSSASSSSSDEDDFPAPGGPADKSSDESDDEKLSDVKKRIPKDEKTEPVRDNNVSLTSPATSDSKKAIIPVKSNPLSVKIRTYNSARKESNNVMRKSGPNKYTCQYCAKGCMHLETLERHMSRNHQDQLADKGNTCKLCKSKFKESQLLKCHIKTHNLRFSCAICGRKFSSQKFLDIHINIHFHEKEFPCELCEQGFSTQPELKEHYEWHEEELAM